MSRTVHGHWLLGHILDLYRDPLRTFTDTYREGGPVVRLRLKVMNLYLIAHPDHVQQVLQTGNRNYVLNRKAMPLARSIMGQNLLTIDGDRWAKHRRIMQPEFQPDRLSEFVQPVVGATQESLDDWQQRTSKGQSLDLAEGLRLLSLRIGARTLLGSGLDRDEEGLIADGITAGMAYFAYRSRNPLSLPLAVPTPYNLRNKRLRARVYALFDRIIEKRRREPHSHPDLLQRLLDARDPQTGEGLTNEEIRFESIGMLTAASETIANALSWTISLLCQHPAERDKVQAEIESVLNDQPPGGEDVSRLVRMRMVLEESMRLFPPTWLLGRTAIKEDRFGDTVIPAGSHLAISPYVTHRLPDFWEYPEEFHPERFAAQVVASRHRFAYYPFGGGPRACIGRYLAMVEMPLILSMILQRFQIELRSALPIPTEPQLSLRPRGGMLVGLQPARPAVQPVLYQEC